MFERMVGRSMIVLFAVGCGGRLLDVQTDASDAAMVDVEAEAAPTKACALIPPSDPNNPTTGCSIVGTWVITDGLTSAKALIEFDTEGAFYGGPQGTDLSQTYTFDGPYRIENATTVHVLTSCGLDCGFDAAFKMQFSNSCSSLKLIETFDNCTGARKLLRETPVMTRQ
jgi:hypothetical protein